MGLVSETSDLDFTINHVQSKLKVSVHWAWVVDSIFARMKELTSSHAWAMLGGLPFNKAIQYCSLTTKRQVIHNGVVTTTQPPEPST
jgi:hypothetical protein